MTRGSQRLAVALAVMAGGAAAAVYFAESERRYHPIVRVKAPEGVVYTAFSDEVAGRPACEAANRSFVEPLGNDCPACEVQFTRCERKAEARALRLESTNEGPPHVVSLPGMRILVSGPQALARATCELMAGELARQGVEDPRCFSSTAP